MNVLLSEGNRITFSPQVSFLQFSFRARYIIDAEGWKDRLKVLRDEICKLNDSEPPDIDFTNILMGEVHF